jgi:hypothetical protein
MSQHSADDFNTISQRLKEIEAEKLPKAEMPKVKPAYGWPYTANVDSGDISDTAPCEYSPMAMREIYLRALREDPKRAEFWMIIQELSHAK